MKNTIIIDTSFFISIFNRSDSNHQKAKSELANLNQSLITTTPVITETCHLLLKQTNFDFQMKFLRSHKAGAFKIYELIPDDLLRMIELMEKYSDVSMDFADASLIILAERLNHGEILTFDSDFEFYKWGKSSPFIIQV